MRLTAKERRALRVFEKSPGDRDYSGVHGHTIHALERKGLIATSARGRRLTATGRRELAVPDIFADLLVPTAAAVTDNQLRSLRDDKSAPAELRRAARFALGSMFEDRRRAGRARVVEILAARAKERAS